MVYANPQDLEIILKFMDLPNKKPDIRYLYDIKEVLYDQEWLKTAPNLELYYMYRGVEEKNGLRYDVTLIPARMLGKEFVKTKGHYHAGSWQEIYIVLEGEALFLMQKGNSEKIEDVFAVKARKGQSVIIPSFYGHVTINPSNEDLKMANWISADCQSDYKLFEQKQGTCYYYLNQGWLKNKNYGQVPELRFQEPLNSVPDNLDFLK